MLGHLDDATLTERTKASRSQDAVGALGLLPLAGGGLDRQRARQHRYGVMGEFERGSRVLGSQRQASERTAVRIGIENLARTGGYASPQRFVGAVEASEAADLAAGPVTVTHGDVTLQLAVTGDGTPTRSTPKGRRGLGALPAALRKAEEVVALRARTAAVAQRAARVREALESAMVAQDTFTARDLAGLRRPPLVARVLGKLVWVDGQGRTLWQAGGQAGAADGTPVTVRGALRLAHPADLVADGSWVAWQERLFAGECRQPFKPVFRGLHVPTARERQAPPASRRYEGPQLPPRHAPPPLGPRGWVTPGPAGAICIIPVGSQHRGRLSLPFADDDPKTAEIVSKTLLLARDHEIRDPRSSSNCTSTACPLSAAQYTISPKGTTVNAAERPERPVGRAAEGDHTDNKSPQATAITDTPRCRHAAAGRPNRIPSSLLGLPTRKT